MASTEKLPSGRFRGIYYDYSRKPPKRRVPGTYRLKREAKAAATEAEGRATRHTRSVGQFSANATYAEWLAYWWPKRDIEVQTNDIESGIRDRALLPKWGGTKLNEFNAADIQDWVDEMRQELSPSSVARRFGIFRTSLKAAIDRNIIYGTPWGGVRLPRVPSSAKEHFEDDELEQVKRHLGTHYRETIDLLVDTGLRPSELAGLHRDHVRGDWLVVAEARAGDRRLIKRPKDSDHREVPLTDRAKRILESWMDTPPHDGCGLEHQDGKTCRSDVVWRGLQDQPLSAGNFRNILVAGML